MKFAKTKFVADAALAGGAFKRYIYTPAKDGKLKKGAKRAGARAGQGGRGRRLRDQPAEGGRDGGAGQPDAVQGLRRARPQKFSAALTGLVGKAKSGGINPSDVDGASSALTDVHNAATSGGAGFADNANASITG